MEIKKGKRILVVCAHPDDEVLGAGGTMARMAQAGAEVRVVYAATGAAGRYEDPEANSNSIAKETASLKENAAEACSVLGAQEPVFLDLPDNRLDTMPKMDIVHLLKKIGSDFLPDIVMTHHFGDYNWDHTICHEAVLMAFRAEHGAFFPKALYTFEVLSSTERSMQTPGNVFCPSTYVNIESTMNKKKQALSCYPSEIRKYPHPRSPEAVEALARKRGVEAALGFAEAFMPVRLIVD